MNRFKTTTKFAVKVGFDWTIKCLSKICPFTVDPKTFIVTSGPILLRHLYGAYILKDVKLLVKASQAEARVWKHQILKLRSWRSRITRTNSYITNVHSQNAMSINWLLGLKLGKIVYFCIRVYSLKKATFDLLKILNENFNVGPN